MTDRVKGLVYIFPDKELTEEMVGIIKTRTEKEDLFIGYCEHMIIIDLDKCAMYVANKDNPNILKLKEIET